MLDERTEWLIERKSFSEQVYDHIKRRILSGAIKEGQKIPETAIANHFHVSRTPVREAIRKLAEYGLVVIKPWTRAVVASIDQKDAQDISSVRLVLERLSFRAIASMATPKMLAPLYRLAEECRSAINRGDFASAYEADSAIHLGIAELTGNGELYKMLQNLDAKLQLVRLKQHLSAEQLSVYFGQHETLLHLLEERAVAKIDTLLEHHILHHLDFGGAIPTETEP